MAAQVASAVACRPTVSEEKEAGWADECGWEEADCISRQASREGVTLGDRKEEEREEEGEQAGVFDDFDELQMPNDTEVIYVREDVSVWPTRRDHIDGRLTLIKQASVTFVAWLPYTHGTLNQDGTFSATPQVGAGKASNNWHSDRTMYAVHPIPLSEIKAIRKTVPTIGWHYLCIVLVNGLTLPPLYFNNGGVRAFLAALKQHAFLMKSPEDPTTYLVNDTVDPLQRSLTSLELADVLIGAPPPGASATWGPHHGDVAASWCIGEGGHYGGFGHHSHMNGNGLSSMSMHIIEQFSRVARMARDTTSSLEEVGGAQSSSPMFARAPLQEPPWRKACNQPDAIDPSSNRRSSGPYGEEASTSVGMFELLDNYVDLAAASRKRVRPPPLGLEEWGAFLDSEGRLVNESGFKQRVFYSGLSPSLRKEGWKFLLGLYPASSTAVERSALAAARGEEYETLKRQWSTISKKQASCFSKWRERQTRVEKDVHRTDRSHPYFADDNDPETVAHLQQLRAILLTYCMFNFDMGYCQGMSDLAAPILTVMQNEADAFWCFVALMERMQSNFHTDQTGMHSQLLALRQLVALLDPQLHAFLEAKDCLNYFFCFRWVLIQFKREFAFDAVLRLWEALWTRHLSDHFHLFMCVAVLEQHRRCIMRDSTDFDALLKFCIDLAGNIDLDSVLRDAEALCMYAGEAGKECTKPLQPSPPPVTAPN
eukprot:CAMPEP_0177782312 /NCGR_PEP_ID=MMETSP0491_2-20121128/18382_1 /TAXON_ID=63592 /ORGANISM="Tetraselmis chuii, Strain PLY429" /LENGTH=709 /DNA_ID=CAMNT_0019302567 /DNA_START=173 /DNA_END=2302 /DNA_ORIENTATION=+